MWKNTSTNTIKPGHNDVALATFPNIQYLVSRFSYALKTGVANLIDIWSELMLHFYKLQTQNLTDRQVSLSFVWSRFQLRPFESASLTLHIAYSTKLTASWRCEAEESYSPANLASQLVWLALAYLANPLNQHISH